MLILLTYLINTLNAIHIGLEIVAVFSGLLCVFLGLYVILSDAGTYSYYDTDREGKPFPEAVQGRANRKAWTKLCAWVMVISTTLAILIPSEKTAYMMAGVYIAQKVVESPITAQLADKASNRINRIVDGTDEINSKVYTIINNKLDSYIEEQTNSTQPTKQ